MTQDFKTKLQELIDEAANERASNCNIGRAVKEWAHDVDNFQRGAAFLMPMIERLVGCREDCMGMAYSEGAITDNHLKYYSDNELLNLLKGEKNG